MARVLTVVPSAAVSVRSREASPVTEIDSVTSPSWSVASAVMVSPACSTMPSRENFLKPGAVISRRYVPRSTSRKRYKPVSSETSAREAPVSELVSLTAARATTAPVASLTTPLRLLLLTCAGTRDANANARETEIHVTFIDALQTWGGRKLPGGGSIHQIVKN